MNTKLYGICPIHKEESYFVYQGSRDIPYKRVEDIYLCGRCEEMITLTDILKKNNYVIGTDKKSIKQEITDVINLVEKNGVWEK